MRPLSFQNRIAMKKIIVTIVLLLGVWPLAAQGLRVEATSGGEPLGFAYIYVNGRAVGAADAAGRAFVELGLLHPGDTVSASFVGMRDAYTVYDGEVMQRGAALLDLVPNTEIPEVVVIDDKHSERYFRRYVRVRPVWGWWGELSGDFDCQVVNRQGGSQSVAGTLSYAMIPPSDDAFYPMYPGHNRLEAPAGDHPRAFQEAVRNGVETILYDAALAAIFDRKVKMNRDLMISYKGESGNLHRFLILRPGFSPLHNENFQVLLFVDTRSREIVSAEVTRIYNGGEVRIDFEARYRVWQPVRRNTPDNQRGGAQILPVQAPSTLYPFRITGRYSRQEGYTAEVDLPELSFRVYPLEEARATLKERDAWENAMGFVKK